MTIEDISKNSAYEGFKKRYPNVPLLIVYKTVDYAKSLGKAFDNMEDFDFEFPIIYNTDTDKWEATILIENQLTQGILFE